MDFKCFSSAVVALVFSSGISAAPMYYVFEGSLTIVNDAAGLAVAENLAVGSAIRTVFLVDKVEAGTETSLSMFPFLNQQFTTTLSDRTYNNGTTEVDYFYADMISQPLLYGDSWSDLGTIESNYGESRYETISGVNYFNLTGSNSPDTTGAVTELTSSAQYSEDFLGAEFRFYETATIQQGSLSLTSSLFGRMTLVSVSDTYVSTVPLPSAIWLFGTGLVGLVGVAKRKKV